MRRNRSAGRSCLRSERLETRDLMAGDVAVVKSGTTLKITGDGAGNEVVILGDATPGTYHVFAIDADASGDTTTINGQLFDFSGDVLTFTSIRNLNVNLNGGDDFFAMTNVPADSGPDRLNALSINTQSGDDRVSLGNVDFDALIDAGFDVTIASMLQAISGPFDQRATLLVNTADGNDSVSVRGLTSGGAQTILLGAGDDDLLLDSVAASAITVNFGTGAVSSVANAAISTTGNLTILAANGTSSPVDIAIIGLVINGNATITLGTGANALDLQNGTFGGNLNIVAPSLKNNSVSNSADIYLSGLAIQRVASIVTGTGDDAVNYFGCSADILSIVTGNGNDRLAISSQEGEPDAARIATINTGNGDDEVHLGADGETFFGLAAFDRLTVLLGAGDDCLAVGSTTVRSFANFNGGIGRDNFDDNLGNAFPTAASKNIRVLFETFEDCDEDE